ncbi:hypothetical protein NEMIN01_1298 [Nematocida minor]|uniref:uncharacterized protein n=1 Tax=Nematocida minor TaxID=1912983 RepID=UPI0022207615|nr:uncharacterized protein NEMIN01_1298 [Nematocida minor]KAI5190965.1 hypothetical protein NEMIN01_1298 [Nematocida minor]
MNFNKTMQGALDTLKLAKDFKKREEVLPFTYADFFAEKSSLLETLGLSRKQKAGCMLISAVLSMFFFFRAVMSLISLPITPEAFGWNFSMFSIFVLVILSFFSGFKTFFKNIFAKDMLVYSIAYLASTFAVMICRSWMYILRLPITLIELAAFVFFMYAYSTKKFKSGLRGLGSMLYFF